MGRHLSRPRGRSHPYRIDKHFASETEQSAVAKAQKDVILKILATNCFPDNNTKSQWTAEAFGKAYSALTGQSTLFRFQNSFPDLINYWFLDAKNFCMSDTAKGAVSDFFEAYLSKIIILKTNA